MSIVTMNVRTSEDGPNDGPGDPDSSLNTGRTFKRIKRTAARGCSAGHAYVSPSTDETRGPWQPVGLPPPRPVPGTPSTTTIQAGGSLPKVESPPQVGVGARKWKVLVLRHHCYQGNSRVGACRCETPWVNSNRAHPPIQDSREIFMGYN